MSLVALTSPAPGIRLIEMTDGPRYNALSAEMVTELKEAFATTAAERDTRVVILQGAGKGFCSGADLSFSGAAAPDTEGRGPVGIVQKSQEHLAQLLLQIREHPKAVIAAVHGGAVGGGFALALACDIRVAAEGAFLSAHFVQVGMSSCDVGTSYTLPRLVGAGRALELMTGRRCYADEAERIGLVTKVPPLDGLFDAAMETATAIASLSEYSSYFTKLGFWANLDASSYRQAMELENRTQVLASFVGNMSVAGKAFMEKRAPEWLPM